MDDVERITSAGFISEGRIRSVWRPDGDFRLSDFEVGDRVELHPGTNAWIFGDRYGEVVKVGRKLVHVHMDRSGRTLKLFPIRFYAVHKPHVC